MTIGIQPLNYSTHAIEDFQRFVSELEGREFTQSLETIKQLIKLLTEGVKFMLPNCGALLDPSSINQAHLDLTQLPFPCTVFEAPWRIEDEDFVEYIGDYKTTPSARRIALCWDTNHIEFMPGMNRIHEKHPEGGTCVVPIYWTQDEGMWTPSMGGVFIPRVNTTTRKDYSTHGAVSKANLAAKQAGLSKENSLHYGVEPFILLTEIFEHAVRDVGETDALAQVVLDCRDEAQMVIQACSVLNCANVVATDLLASAALNKKRTAKNKLPFFSYKVLQLDSDSHPSGQSGGDGSHSARMHLRRGHLRRLESKTIWVRAAVINAASPHGQVDKVYSIGKSD